MHRKAAANRVQGPQGIRPPRAASRSWRTRDIASRKSAAHIIENTARTLDERASNYYSCMNAPANTSNMRRPPPLSRR